MIMNKLRSQYLYRLIGQIQNKKPRQSLKGQFYQLQITCENIPKVDKIFVFDDKLTNSSIWAAIEQDHCFNQKYLLLCKNYQGHYYLVDWKELNNGTKSNSEPELIKKSMINNKKCQAQYSNCQEKAQFQHILKLGSVSIGKQWVCANCKQILESK